MSSKNSKYVILVLVFILAIVFTFALAYTTLELPVVLGNWLSSYFPDIHPVIEPERVAEFVDSVRPVGYACLGVIAAFIVAGFVTGKRGLSVFGSFALFLPTFGYFFASMFFLAGLGIIRVPLIPFWDAPINLMNFGDISYLPYMVIVYPFYLTGLDVRTAVSLIAIITGLFIFILGTATWFYGKVQKREIINFWIYRFSRHPQYLGFIIWSYGVMLLAALEPVPRGGQNPGASLSWLLAALVIVCIALAEEARMDKRDEAGYRSYRAQAPFMLPVPRIVSSAFRAPMRLVLKKNQPETGKEILVTFVVYSLILILLSLPFALLHWPPMPGWSAWPV
jgi:protein-S-isoprenylcysteine O-methyltransferase Ste14